jgi:ABC-type nitrate/sulfonate/bicarbonate transport system substrate-binding protein
VVLVIILGAGASPRAAEKIVVGYAQGPGLWPIWVTEEAGYFKQNGLDVEFVFTSGSEVTMAALISGNLFLSAGGSAAGISAVATGAPVVLIGRCGRPPSSLYTSDPSVQTVDDLKGKTVTSGALQSDSMVLRIILQRAGMKYEDVWHMYIASRQARFTALMSKLAAAAVLSPPEDYLAKKSGLRQLVDFNSTGHPLMLCGLWTRRTNIDRQPLTLQALIRSFVQGFARFKQDKAFALSVFRKYTRNPETEIAEHSYERQKDVVPKKPYVIDEGLLPLIDSVAATKPELKARRPSDFYDNRFVKHLDNTGFIDALYK